MVIVTTIVYLKPGYDSDEAWRLWCEDHGPRSLQLLSPELRSCTLHRVVKVMNDSSAWGFATLEFDDVASAERAMERSMSQPPDKFKERVALTERIIVEPKRLK